MRINIDEDNIEFFTNLENKVNGLLTEKLEKPVTVYPIIKESDKFSDTVQLSTVDWTKSYDCSKEVMDYKRGAVGRGHFLHFISFFFISFIFFISFHFFSFLNILISHQKKF